MPFFEPALTSVAYDPVLRYMFSLTTDYNVKELLYV